ncbi:MAG TPA: acyltransferase domain-containing protein [Limnochordia bacterium]
MDLNDVLRTLRLEPHAETLTPEWEAAQRVRPERLPFLDPAFIARAARAIQLPPEPAELLLTIGRLVEQQPALSALAWYCHFCLFEHAGHSRRLIGRWPSLAGVLPEAGDLFYLLVLLSGLPRVEAFHRERAIPRDIVQATLADASLWVEEYRREHGRWGLAPRLLNWLMNHFRGELYRLGRLQFAPGPFWGDLVAYRHRKTRAVLALSAAGIRYRSDGQIDGAGGVRDPEGAWIAELEVTDSEVVGYPIAPTGAAVRRPVRLSLAEWQRVLSRGDPALHIHVPAGSPMDFAACGDSFRAALDFFPRYFPDRPFTAFCCGSWFLDPQFERLLPAHSNIVRFLQEMYVFPIASDERSALERVFGFGRVPSDLRQAPRDTTLRRAIIDHLLGGGHLHGGGAFLLVDDLAWGEQVYRRQAMPG